MDLHDRAGFFSLICLLIQCGLAWTLIAFFAVLQAKDSRWMRCWQVAFFGLGVALLAMNASFASAPEHVVGTVVIRHVDLGVRLLHGIYVAGKVVFVWFLVGGVAGLRQRYWPASRWWPGAFAVAGFAVGVVTPTAESLILFQAPGVVSGFWYAAFCLRANPDEEPDIGRRIARLVFAAWGLAWCIYGVAVVAIGPLQADGSSDWNLVLRFNPLVDLTMQVSLAFALIVVVLHDAERASLAAAAERDRLRERVQRDEQLRTLSTLVGGVTHEINNPLTAILGFADALASDDNATRIAAAKVVREQAERCRDIIRRISMMGRLPKPTDDLVDMRSLLERVVRGFQPQLAAAGVTVDLIVEPLPRQLQADAIGLEQVMTNLIANALHASPRGGRITVRMQASTTALHIVVQDQGAGVPLADRGRIFEPFWTSKKPDEGTGLGLAVAQVLVQAHDGRIEVGDADGGGAVFEVVLPWVRANDPRTDPVAGEAGSARGVR